jgi:lactate permease
MPVFQQIYDPVAGSVALSAILASFPLLVLGVLLAVVRMAPWRAAIVAAAAAFALACLVWRMPFRLALSASTHGMAFGLWPISWVVVSAVFFYNLTVASGDFDVIRRALARLTSDRRIQVLLVAFCFGALIEGIAGFGAPVAITASMLAGLGFPPVTAAVLSLVANTAPVAFGSIGIPVTTLGGLVAPILGKDSQETTRALSAMVGRQLPFFSVLIPTYLVVLLAGWKRTLDVLPAVLTVGLSFALVQFLVANYVGPELTDTLASLASLTALTLLLRVWRPRELDAMQGAPGAGGTSERGTADPPSRVARAFGSYAILVLVVLAGQVGNFAGLGDLRPPLNVTALLRCGQSGNQLCAEPWFEAGASSSGQAFRFPVWEMQWPGSFDVQDGARVPLVRRGPPIVLASAGYPLTYRLEFMATAGTLVLIAAFVAFVPMFVGGLRPMAFAVAWVTTLRQLRLPVVTIAFILSIATLMNYSGMTSSMALALASTGVLFPFFSAFLGMLGVFLTGSDTSSNTLFGPLQATTAQVSGLDPVLTAATNSSGGVMGKMISPQNLSVGAAGVGLVGSEGVILRRVILHSLALTTLMGLLAMVQAYLLPWMIPRL